MTKRFWGMDVHKRIAQLCFVDEQGVIHEESLGTSRSSLMAFAQHVLQPEDELALEATTNTWAVARLLRPFVARLVVSNPLKTKAIAEAKVKTDKVDAFVLARLLEADFLPGVWQPDEATQKRRSMASRRAALVGQRTAIKNRIHSVLAERLIEVPFQKLWSLEAMDWLRKLDLDEWGRWMIDSDLRLLEGIEAEIDLLAKRMDADAFADERVKLLMTLPGVDVAVAESLVAALGDVKRFPSADQAAAYLGLVPRVKQSAASCYHGSITKAGRSQTRWMLVQAAQHVGAHPGPLGAFFRRLARRKNRNVAVVATARKLVTIAWHMLHHREPYRYAVARGTEDKLRRLRVSATGQKRRGGGKRRSDIPPTPGSPTRVQRGLAEVYSHEGLPPQKTLKPGEESMLAQNGHLEWYRELQKTQRQPRRVRPSVKKEAAP